MGLRLLFLSWWTPEYVIRRELANVADQTTTALKNLLDTYVQAELTHIQKQKAQSLQEQRAEMAKTHAALVEALVAAVGHDKAVELGRETLFSVGQELGKQARIKLGVGDSPADLTRAAKILYRILGITFHLDWNENQTATAIIDRCALAEQYSKLTCEVLSATDEGVIRGLQPNVTMEFKEYMTSGCPNCKASLQFNVMEKVP